MQTYQVLDCCQIIPRAIFLIWDIEMDFRLAESWICLRDTLRQLNFTSLSLAIREVKVLLQQFFPWGVTSCVPTVTEQGEVGEMSERLKKKPLNEWMSKGAFHTPCPLDERDYPQLLASIGSSGELILSENVLLSPTLVAICINLCTVDTWKPHCVCMTL